MLDFRVKIRYHPLEASGEDASPERASRVEGVFSPFLCRFRFPHALTLSLFAHKAVFASPSFPNTYSLFQKEYSRKSNNPKALFTLSRNTRVAGPLNFQTSHLAAVTSSLYMSVHAGIPANPLESDDCALFRARRGVGVPHTPSRLPRASRCVFAHTRTRATPFVSCVYFTVLCKPRGG